MSDAAADVTGQSFAVRNNEIILLTQPRPYARRRHPTAGRRELCRDGFARFEAVYVQPRPFIGCICVGSFLREA